MSINRESIYFTCGLCMKLRHRTFLRWRGNVPVCTQCVEAGR